MTKASNITSIETATGRAWADWVLLLGTAGGRDLEHHAIAELVHEELGKSIESAGWWAQGVTVAYEQYIGKREPGQRNDGSYELSVTRRILGLRDDVFALWNEAHGAVKSFGDQAVTNIRTSTTPVRSYWRCDLADGSKVAVSVEAKGEDRAMIAVTHTHLKTTSAKDKWRVFWGDQLQKL